MNNNYENSNYLCNYYNDYNYHSFNQTNDKRFESLYENLSTNSYQNFEYKIASNIASNYRQIGNQWIPDWGYPPTDHNSYYEQNHSYNRLEPLIASQSLPAIDELETYENQFVYNQNQNILEKPYESVFKSNLDDLIPVTVTEIEKQIKIEREFDEIISNETSDLQMDCLRIRQEILHIGDNSRGEPSAPKQREYLNVSNVSSVPSLPKPLRIRRKNRKLMSYDELKRDKRECNRLAATKCRQKKLQQLEALDKKSKLLSEENDRLEQRLNGMRAQVYEKKLALIHHRITGCLLNAFGN